MWFYSKSFTVKQKRQAKGDDGDNEKIGNQQQNKQLVKESVEKVEEWNESSILYRGHRCHQRKSDKKCVEKLCRDWWLIFKADGLFYRAGVIGSDDWKIEDVYI